MIHFELYKLTKLAVIGGTVLALLLAAYRPASERLQRALTGLFVVLALVATLAYVDFGRFHNGESYVHRWEMFHYHLGSKYFAELGYDGLYPAALAADSEEADPALDSVAKVRDLRSYRVVERAELEMEPPWRTRFTAERWQSFRRDLRYFKPLYRPAHWQRLFLDHGYNAPPSRTWLTAALANGLGAASDGVLLCLGLLDPLLLGLLLIGVGRVYGTRTAALVTILFGVNELAAFLWVGGSFLRCDWLVLAGLGICSLRTGRFALAGALLGGAAMLRIFPAFFAVGVLLRGLFRFSKSGVWEPRYTRFGMGLALSGGVLLLAGLFPGGSTVAWQEFLGKIQLHHGSLFANHVGLLNVAGGHPQLYLNPLLLWISQAVAVVVYLLSLRRLENDSQAAILGGVLVFVFTTIACYYYAFLILFVLWRPREPDGALGGLFHALLLLAPAGVIALQSLIIAGVRVPLDAPLPYILASAFLALAFTVLFVRVWRWPRLAG